MARRHHISALLPDGKVLVAGGTHKDGDWPEEVLAAAELYDPINKTVSPAGRMISRRYFAAVTVLANSTLLITGGLGENGHALDAAEVYHHGTFVSIGRMTTPRRGHTATLLRSGKVLIAGGDDHQGRRLSSAELFDPSTATFSPTGGMIIARITEHTSNAVLLEDGRVLIAGGYGGNTQPPQLSSAEIYDPEKAAFQPAGSMVVRRACHTLSLLPNGKILITGGHEDDGGHLASAELYDPIKDRFTLIGSMADPHFLHTAIRLPSGKVLIVGGFSPLVELCEPEANTFIVLGRVITARYLHTSILLSDNRVLLIGGSAQNTCSLSSIELGPVLCQGT
jgi:WD40 repeat protein